MNVHFWPGRGMNSGMKGAMALARNILRSCLSNNSIQIRTPLKFLDFLDYEGFMARLRAREQQGRSLRVLNDPIDKCIEACYSYAYTNHCYVTYRKKLIEKLKETRERLAGRPEWPHKSREISDEELHSAIKRISPPAVAQLTLANPWPTREMSGADVLVENTFPYDITSFLPVPSSNFISVEHRPTLIVRDRFVILWIIGLKHFENIGIGKLIQDIRKSSNFMKTTENEDTVYKLAVVYTVEQAEEWIKSNRSLIQKSNVIFKVITLWKIKGNQTAVDVIRAVRLEAPRAPILVYTKELKEIQLAREFPNVQATDAKYELKEFVGINQETQWDQGCLTSLPVTPSNPNNPKLITSTYP